MELLARENESTDLGAGLGLEPRPFLSFSSSSYFYFIFIFFTQIELIFIPFGKKHFQNNYVVENVIRRLVSNILNVLSMSV